MNELLQFFKDYGSLVNTALILSLTGIAFKIFEATITQKDAELKILEERMKNLEIFVIAQYYVGFSEAFLAISVDNLVISLFPEKISLI